MPDPTTAEAPPADPRVRQRLISDPGSAIREDRTAATVAVVTGVIFVFAGLVKFVFHGWELNAFRSFGLPWPSALELFAGVLETLGGLLLALRLAVAPVAVLLAATMAVAIGASGIGHGDVIPSLTLAPALLLALAFLLARTLRRGAIKRTYDQASLAPGTDDQTGLPEAEPGSAAQASMPVAGA